jgi:hypothetical protein
MCLGGAAEMAFVGKGDEHFQPIEHVASQRQSRAKGKPGLAGMRVVTYMGAMTRAPSLSDRLLRRAPA